MTDGDYSNQNIDKEYMKIYLCGPIAGCTDEECKDWRGAAKVRFSDSVDPMRRDYRGREKENVQKIVELDKLDIDACECLLVNHPKPSVGSAMEILYAWERKKIIVIVCPKDVVQSPWLVYHSNVIVDTFDEAYEIIEDIIIRDL